MGWVVILHVLCTTSFTSWSDMMLSLTAYRRRKQKLNKDYTHEPQKGEQGCKRPKRRLSSEIII